MITFTNINGGVSRPRTPAYESGRYAFYVLRVRATIVRKRDNASVYFQPGDDTARAEQDAERCIALSEMYPDENTKIFDRWCAEYFQ